MADYKTVAAYFPSQSSAESAILKLKQAGFQQSQIGLATAGTATTADQSGSTSYKAGHAAGNAWEKFKSMFEGNSAEPYAGETTKETFNDNVITPDPVYGSEDLHGSLADMSVAQEHSRYFGHRMANGEGLLVTVNAAGREAEALEILEQSGGDVGANAAGYDYGTTPSVGAQNIQLYGEVLRVNKDRIQRGEVRIRKEVHSTTQTVEVPVTREELVIERTPVTGVTTATGSAFQGEEIRIPLTEERASVTKEAVVREEVRVGKKEVTTVESHDEQVRHEELSVEGDTKKVPKTGSY